MYVQKRLMCITETASSDVCAGN